jgi:predicted RNA-binding protein
MCQASIVVEKPQGDEIIMKDVIQLRLEGDKIWLSRFFEEPVSMRASIEEIDFLKHTVRITPLGAKPGMDS